MERYLPGLIGLTVFGVPTLYLAWQVWLARRSRNWPSTVGRIVRSEVRHNPERMGRNQGVPYVRYEYEVDGRAYTGTRVKFGGWLNANPWDAGRVVIRYRDGSPVSVRYDPRRPSRCTLERRLSRLVWLWLGFGLFMAGGIFGALIGWWD